MTIPVRRVRRVNRGRRFDLRTTALFFLLLAISLCVVSFLARTAAGIVEHRPLWAVALALLGGASALMFRDRWRRFSAARCARRAARALEAGAETAADSLRAGEAAVFPAGAAAPGGPPAEMTAPESTPVATVPPAPGAGEETTALALVTDYAALDPDGFEQAVAELCTRDGCRAVETVGGPGDLGADVTAVTSQGRRVVIQCKQYGDGNKVGSQDLQRFGGTCFTVHGADVAVVVTTSDFTAPALEYADQCGIVCVSGQELEAWRDGSGPSLWDRVGIEP
ncbi:restriction endonuclease [Streptomyces lucensis]|nr:restriction endonuclease [Streptomyces lucensis]